MIANRMKSVFLAVAIVAALAPAADARNRWGGHIPRHHRVENARWDRQGDGRWNRPAEIGRMSGFYRASGFHGVSGSFVRRLGAYGGSIEAYRVRGHGIYFLRDYWPGRETTVVAPAPKAKIINVDGDLRDNRFAAGSACSYEAGVCVIRGGN